MLTAVDFDDTLFDSLPVFFDWHNLNHGTNFSLKDAVDWELSKVLGISKDEEVRRWFNFFNSEHARKIKPFEDAEYVFGKLKSGGNDFVIVTARPVFTNALTRELLEKYFLGIFNEIYHTRPYSAKKSDTKIPKHQICRDLKADLIIDDRLETVRECHGAGIETYIFDRPWNRNGDIPEEIKRIYSWREFLIKQS